MPEWDEQRLERGSYNHTFSSHLLLPRQESVNIVEQLRHDVFCASIDLFFQMLQLLVQCFGCIGITIRVCFVSPVRILSGEKGGREITANTDAKV
jgi:hypothetical protein